MDLRETIEFIRGLEKELALFNVAPTDPIPGELSTFLRTQNVTVTVHATASGRPADVAVLSSPDAMLEVLDVELLRELVAHPASDAGGVGISDTAFDDVLGHLKETTFTGTDTADMLSASREIEDRARRTGRGTIHAGFQRCSNLLDQQAIYGDLADRGIAVHAYGFPDVTPPDIGEGAVHASPTAELAETWFVVFDGGDDATQKSALLAEERTRGRFYGVWTYDPAIVDGVCDYLERTYLSTDDALFRSGA